MIIAKTRLVKIPESLKEDECYFIGVEANEENLKKINISDFENGIFIKPSPKYGPTCRKNLYGYFNYDKNLPKEYRYVSTLPWQFTLKNGDIISGYNDIYKNCIHRDKIDPYNIDMILVIDRDNKKMIVSKIDNFNHIKEIINIYLEVFGYCETLNENLKSSYVKTHYGKKNWEILPSGIKNCVLQAINNSKFKNNKKAYFIKERLETLENANPIEKYSGLNALDGYLAFVYNNICILECPIYGNATYIIKRDNWEQISTLDKSQIIKSEYFIKKVEHNALWFDIISDEFKSKN